MKVRIENYLPVALSIIREGIGKGNKVAEEYDGYAASLGPAIIASGLLPAISFYTDIHKDKGDSKPHRFEILRIISGVLKNKDNMQITSDKNGLLEFLLDKNIQEREALKPVIMDAVIAIKLSLRNFKQVKTN
ncbi:MAG TPA: type III-B CRISPR module-associated protein Cmr5 [Chitinophagaceae bacterium]|nr:type III-B CRISPR module-associated protein Cmr5 [Chitinophagaceae bacterium]HNU16084.1 type III-B CRISPR module-associated protein Cmr5 [Chitinophagaceae bacterium]